MPTLLMGHARSAVTATLAVTASLALVACGSSSSSSSTSSSSGSGSTSSASPSSTSSAAAAAPASFPDYAHLGPPNFTPPAGSKKIAVLLPSTELPSQKSIQIGFQDAAKKYNVKLTQFNAGGFGNVATQVSQLETAIGQHPDAIVVIPVSPVALNAGIAAAAKQGITVTAALIPPSAPQVAFSIVDPIPLDGALAATGLAKAIGGKGDLYRIFGGAGGAPNTLFAQGALAALKAYPQIKIVFQKDFASFSPAEAQTAVENALTAHPNVAGILANDSGLAAGAYRALATAGKGTVPVVGIADGSQQDIQNLRAGKVAIAVAPPFAGIGLPTLEWTLSILEGHKPKQKLIAAPPTVLTKANIDQALSGGAFFKVFAPATIGCGPGQSKQC